MAISIELAEEIRKELDQIAKDTERTRSQVIRLAIKKIISESKGELKK